jgi:formate dehydrogenase subunit delta
MNNIRYSALINAPAPSKDLEKLLGSLNSIGNFFELYPEEEAIKCIVEHMQTYMALSLRQKIVNHLNHGGVGMKVIVQLAVDRLVDAK